MKKIIFLLLTSFVLIVGYTAKSQAPFVGTSTNPTRAILNATADTALYVTTAPYQFITIKTTVTKATGTMAGKVYIWCSADGNDYVLKDSATLTNVTTQRSTFDYSTTNGLRQYWMVIQNGATTVTGTLNAKIWGAGR